MSAILPEDISFIARDAHGVGAGPASLKARLGWLREWEQAQQDLRQQRMKIGNNLFHGRQEPGVVSSGEPDESRNDRGPVGTESRHVTRTGTYTKALNNQILFRPTQMNASIRVVQPGGQNLASVSYSPGLSVPRFYVSVSSSPETAPFLPSTWKASYAEWQPYLMHVVREAGGLRVWIRNNRLDEPSKRNMLASIRNELSLHGINLLSLIVNGEVIWRLSSTGSNGTTSFSIDRDATINRTY